jgi:Holliday junction resolvase RusA-like endonuclease
MPCLRIAEKRCSNFYIEFQFQMKNFIFKRQPKAYQGSKTFKNSGSKINYISELETSLRQLNDTSELMTGDLYGVVYYFRKKQTGTDADNISKPIWDCLRGILFDDDKRIKLRFAGIIDIPQGDISLIDLTGVRGEITTEIAVALGSADHFVYVECGSLQKSMYRFNIETNGN